VARRSLLHGHELSVDAPAVSSDGLRPLPRARFYSAVQHLSYEPRAALAGSALLCAARRRARRACGQRAASRCALAERDAGVSAPRTVRRPGCYATAVAPSSCLLSSLLYAAHRPGSWSRRELLEQRVLAARAAGWRGRQSPGHAYCMVLGFPSANQRLASGDRLTVR
jgi:hypothetical protein